VPGSKAALAELCKLYWFPLYAFVRRRGYCPADAQDLAQGFFLHLLDHKSLAEVDPRKGKFRSFLLASIKNYLSKEADRGRCLKRGGNIEFVPLDTKRAEDMVKPTPEQTVQRFEHYQLVTGEDGKPVELGRGAMGVTYKAFDVDLHCPVTLKVMSRRGFVFYAKPARRRGCGIQMLPRYFTWAEPAKTTSTRWSLWRGKHWRTLSNAQAGWR
jgi:hypothetical protein